MPVVPYIILPSAYSQGKATNLDNTVLLADMPYVRDQVVIAAGGWSDENGVAYTYPELELDVLIDATRAKNIVSTAIAGRAGTVKQFVSHGDWMLTFSGTMLPGSGNVYPESLVEALMQIERCRGSVKVYSTYLSRLGITELVITDVRVPQREGYSGTQPFTISAMSDEPFEIVLKEQ